MADEMNGDRATFPEGITRDDTVHGVTYFTAEDMATASAQGFRDGVASLAASAGSDCTRCDGSGEDPEGFFDHSRGPDGCTYHGPCRDCGGKGGAASAGSDGVASLSAAEPLHITHGPLMRHAAALLRSRKPLLPDHEDVAAELERAVDGHPTPSGAPSAEWLEVARIAENEARPAPPAMDGGDDARWLAERENVQHSFWILLGEAETQADNNDDRLLKHQVEGFYRQWNALRGSSIVPRWVERAARAAQKEGSK